MGCSSVEKEPENSPNATENLNNSSNNQNNQKKSGKKYNNNNSLFQLNNSLNLKSSVNSYNLKRSINSLQSNDIQLKRKNTNLLKKPFVIKNVQDQPFSIVQLTVNAYPLRRECTLPIWVDKGEYIKFKVKGKWRINYNYPYTSSMGIPSTHSTKFNYGALVGRIGEGEPFLILDETTQLASKGGALQVRIKLPKNMNLEPEGSLELNIFDGKYMTVEEINEKIGWNEAEKNNNSSGDEGEEGKEFKQKDEEIAVYNNLYNLRMNPKLFYEKNIEGNKKCIWTKEYLNKKENGSANRGPITTNENNYILFNMYFDRINKQKQNKNQNNIFKSNNLALLQQQLTMALMSTDENGTNVQVFCKLTKKQDPMEICIQYLLDQKFKQFIFDKNVTSMTVKIIPFYYIDSHLICIAVTKEGSFDEKDSVKDQSIKNTSKKSTKKNFSKRINKKNNEEYKIMDKDQEIKMDGIFGSSMAASSGVENSGDVGAEGVEGGEEDNEEDEDLGEEDNVNIGEGGKDV